MTPRISYSKLGAQNIVAKSPKILFIIGPYAQKEKKRPERRQILEKEREGRFEGHGLGTSYRRSASSHTFLEQSNHIIFGDRKME